MPGNGETCHPPPPRARLPPPPPSYQDYERRPTRIAYSYPTSMVHGTGKVEVRSSPTLLSYEQCIARAAAASADVGRASRGEIIGGVGLTDDAVIKGITVVYVLNHACLPLVPFNRRNGTTPSLLSPLSRSSKPFCNHYVLLACVMGFLGVREAQRACSASTSSRADDASTSLVYCISVTGYPPRSATSNRTEQGSCSFPIRPPACCSPRLCVMQEATPSC